VGERGTDPDAALLHCAGAETDQVIAGEAERDVDLGANAVRLDAEDASGSDLREHGGGQSSRHADERPRADQRLA
jgi:hypothetical protein